MPYSIDILAAAYQGHLSDWAVRVVYKQSWTVSNGGATGRISRPGHGPRDRAHVNTSEELRRHSKPRCAACGRRHWYPMEEKLGREGQSWGRGNDPRIAVRVLSHAAASDIELRGQLPHLSREYPCYR